MLARRLVVIPAGGLFSVKGLAWLEKLRSIRSTER